MICSRTRSKLASLVIASGACAMAVSACAAPPAVRAAAAATPTTAIQTTSPTAPTPTPTPTTTPTTPSPTTSLATSSSPDAPPSPSSVDSPDPTAVAVAVDLPPHFATPDDAMRYLVDAYNRRDIASEMHVTTPDSRAALESERQWVNTFSFDSCTPNAGAGDYSCQFDMVSKVATAEPGTDAFGADVQTMGEITVLVAPALRPGWYMYFNEGCGG